MKIYINLLPPSKKQDLRNSMVLAYAQTLVFVFFLTTLVLSATLFSMRVVLQQEHDYLAEQIKMASASESVDIMNNIREINTFLLATDALQKRYVPWVEVLKDLGALVPPNTRLTRIRTDANNGILIDGVAATREENLGLEESLKRQPFLTNVQSPLSNILQRTNVTFSYEMRYQSPSNASVGDR
jgi:Tfp pilus assembly protein PilN